MAHEINKYIDALEAEKWGTIDKLKVLDQALEQAYKIRDLQDPEYRRSKFHLVKTERDTE